jgi:hypothetical protein
VTACNGGGVWSSAGTAVGFRIIPKFYQTIWFRALSCAGGLAFLWFLSGPGCNELRRRSTARWRGASRSAERIARELHDTLLRSFQGLMLHLQVVDELLPPRQAKDRLELGLDRADQAIAEGRNAVHDLRSAPGSDLAQALQGAADELPFPLSGSIQITDDAHAAEPSFATIARY